MSLWTLPFFLFWAAVNWLYNLILELAPIVGIAIGVVAVIATILSVVVLVVAARVLVPARRRWVRVTGRILIALEIVATLAFAGVAVIVFSAVALLHGAAQ
jgi:hypothetical protein